MKTTRIILALFCLVAISLVSCTQKKTAPASAQDIVPKPVSILQKEGNPVILTKKTVILYDQNFKDQAKYLKDQLAQQCGWTSLSLVENTPQTTDRQPESAIVLLSGGSSHSDTDKAEAYKLYTVDENSVIIEAPTIRGFINGIQSLLQLFPVENADEVAIQPVEIYDYPRFAYRGMHLDVVRHMFSVDFVKKYIDYLAFHKFNTLHWHLTDDQGWRIEMLSYPKLNSIGSWRNSTLIGHFFDEPVRYDPNRYGGFYTRSEVKDILKYAEVRGIMVIPEIDIPGHSRATIAAYPEFSTKPDTTWNVAYTWGMYNRQNNVLAPRPETFEFLKTVFGEVADLFPAPYLHIGGDECSKKWWKEDPFCQQFIKANGLKDEADIQTYIVNEVVKYVQNKGKIIIGWDEILEGELDPAAVIMSWRGEKGGISAAKRKHKAVMTPSSVMYFNRYQTKSKRDSLQIPGYIPLEVVYAYEPVPEALKKEGLKDYILGAQACVWTEYIPTEKDVEYMIFPRMTALSEVLWVSSEKKDFDDFKRRLKLNIIPRYNLWNSDYCRDYEEWTTARVKEGEQGVID
ncbi:MAG: beta-N-acetylhexosaminidase [Prevotellaceae bacterium]|jgi:hexosaminidase|nr:beta-N-acetylhexosaminidase [Prevotellaceae bacterium]